MNGNVPTRACARAHQSTVSNITAFMTCCSFLRQSEVTGVAQARVLILLYNSWVYNSWVRAILMYLGEDIDDGHAQPSLLHRTQKIEVVWSDLQQRMSL